jgi:hypothetical protein
MMGNRIPTLLRNKTFLGFYCVSLKDQLFFWLNWQNNYSKSWQHWKNGESEKKNLTVRIRLDKKLFLTVRIRLDKKLF